MNKGDTTGLKRFYIMTGAALAGMSVIAGAFGAHALRARLEPAQMQVYETAARYQMYHSLALILTGIIAGESSNRYIRYSGNCFLIGIILFSGSLYLLSMQSFFPWLPSVVLGPVTPLGGLFLISGWAFMFWSVIKNKTL